MSLQDAFASAGKQPAHTAIAEYVAKTYLGTKQDPNAKVTNNPHRARRNHAAARLRMYRDDYLDDVAELINAIWDHPVNQDDRKRFVEMAMPMNVTARIVNETSPVYDQAAIRRFEDEAKGARLLVLEDELELHDFMQEAHRLTTLENEVLLWSPGTPSPVTGKRTLRIITPEGFDVIPDPRDHLEIAGVLIDTAPTIFGENVVDASRLQHFELWDDKFLIRLDQAGRIVGSPEPHDFGRIPGVLTHRRKPTQGLLDSTSGRDMFGAHKAVLFLNLCILRLAKSSGENQPILKGILARVAAGQPWNSEIPFALPPEVTMEMLNTKTDPDHFLTAIKHQVGSVAATYGMSYEQFTFQETTDTTSGRAYQVRREKLTEIRNQQKKRWRRVERDLVELLGLDREGFTVDHAELAIPQDAMEEVDLLDKKMRLGLDNPVAFLQRKNPELTPEQAAAELTKNLKLTQKVWDMARAMQTPKNADTQNPGQDAATNGARRPNDSNPPAGVNSGPGKREPQERTETGAA